MMIRTIFCILDFCITSEYFLEIIQTYGQLPVGFLNKRPLIKLECALKLSFSMK